MFCNKNDFKNNLLPLNLYNFISQSMMICRLNSQDNKYDYSSTDLS